MLISVKKKLGEIPGLFLTPGVLPKPNAKCCSCSLQPQASPRASKEWQQPVLGNDGQFRPVADVHKYIDMPNETRYLVVDGNLSGTGVRDAVEGGYLTPSVIGVSDGLGDEIAAWQKRYELAHFRSYTDLAEVDKLDAEGLALRQKLSVELAQAKVQYFSSAKMRLLLP